jgi:hypothetical protein
MVDRAGALREMIGEYEYERSLASSRLDSHQLRRAKLQMAHDILIEHGDQAEAGHVQTEIHALDHSVQADEETLARLDRLLGIYRSTLSRLGAS